MSKAKKNHRNNQILAQNKAHRRSSRKEKQQEWRIPHGSMLLNAANVYSIHGKVPKLTNLCCRSFNFEHIRTVEKYPHI